MDHIAYTLVRKQVKNINLRVYPDGTVRVSAHPRVSKERIDTFVQSKAAFILQAQAQFQSRQRPSGPTYDQGSTLSVWGNAVTIQLEAGTPEGVTGQGSVWTVRLKNPEDADRRKALIQAHSKALFLAQCQAMARDIHQRFAPYGIAMPTIRVRDMKTRWGSCVTQKGSITLNTKLFALPMGYLEYVLYHEFCHLIHPNHSQEYYHCLTHFHPHWKQWRQGLRTMDCDG